MRCAFQTKLLEGYSIYLHGDFKAPPKKDVRACVELSGAVLLSRLPKETECLRDPRTIVIYDPDVTKQDSSMAKLTAVSIYWFLDSVSRYEVMGLQEYRYKR
jgi:hypothetical protein